VGYTARKPKEENLPDKDTAATAPDPPETIPPEADSGTEGLRQALIDSASGGYLSGALRAHEHCRATCCYAKAGGDCSDVTYCEVRDSQKI